MKSALKIVLFNIFIFILSIIIFESFFGYFFKKNNFGYIMRSERQKDQIYEVIHDGQKYRYNYKRNYHGFRGDEIDPSKIDIVFEGGSTGNQKFTPEELTIVGLLNSKLNEHNHKLKIINASTDGKTVKGYVNDFIHWFPKLENFYPKYFIFYIGINDSTILETSKYDIPWRQNNFSKFKDYLKNNSIIIELLKKIQFKYFNKEIRREYSVTKIKSTLYVDYNFIDYKKALKIFKTKSNNDLVEQFYKRLELLKIYIDEIDFIPIFITQINFDGLSNPDLFLINETLKEFCEENNYPIIKLDELITYLEINSFYDTMHTTPKGNRKIADAIYPELINIISNTLK